MRNHDDRPTYRQQVELMPEGPDKHWLHTFAGNYFYDNHGGVIEGQIDDFMASLTHYRRMHKADAERLPDEPLRGMREVLRLNAMLDKKLAQHRALWEEAFAQARRAFILEHGREPGAEGKPAEADPKVNNAIRQAQAAHRAETQREAAKRRASAQAFMDRLTGNPLGRPLDAAKSEAFGLSDKSVLAP